MKNLTQAQWNDHEKKALTTAREWVSANTCWLDNYLSSLKTAFTTITPRSLNYVFEDHQAALKEFKFRALEIKNTKEVKRWGQTLHTMSKNLIDLDIASKKFLNKAMQASITVPIKGSWKERLEAPQAFADVLKTAEIHAKGYLKEAWKTIGTKMIGEWKDILTSQTKEIKALTTSLIPYVGIINVPITTGNYQFLNNPITNIKIHKGGKVTVITSSHTVTGPPSQLLSLPLIKGLRSSFMASGMTPLFFKKLIRQKEDGSLGSLNLDNETLLSKERCEGLNVKDLENFRIMFENYLYDPVEDRFISFRNRKKPIKNPSPESAEEEGIKTLVDAMTVSGEMQVNWRENFNNDYFLNLAPTASEISACLGGIIKNITGSVLKADEVRELTVSALKLMCGNKSWNGLKKDVVGLLAQKHAQTTITTWIGALNSSAWETKLKEQFAKARLAAIFQERKQKQ